MKSKEVSTRNLTWKLIKSNLLLGLSEQKQSMTTNPCFHQLVGETEKQLLFYTL